MAVVRTRSAPPYGLFTAVALAVIATGLAVVFYVMWAKAADDLKNADATNKKVASAADIAAYKNLNTSFDLNAAYLNQANKQITSLSNDLAAAKLSLSRVTADLDQSKKDLAETKQLANSAGLSNTAALKNADDLRAANDRDLAAVKAQIAQMTDASAKAVDARDKAVTDAQAALAKIVDEMEALRRSGVIEQDEYKGKLAQLDAEVHELRLRIINTGNHGTATDTGEPDGKILRVNGASKEVWINLTSKDRIMPGMTFTAYDTRTGVRYTTDDTALGNGSLEVIEVGESSSLCRITRTTPNRAIQAGDLIANLVYHNDRTRKFRFTVVGDFDLDGDGVATAAERERIIVLIKSWGGEIDDDVTSQTDYLVMGKKPASPLPSLDQPSDTPAPATAPADAAAAPAANAGIIGGVGESRSKEQARYEDLQIAAKRLAIPVLNANRFLAMIGYYNTTVVRY